MELREPFVALQRYLADPAGAASLRAPAPLSLPANTPPQLAQQVWNQVVQQAMQNAANAGVEVPYSLVNAVIESTRVASEFRTAGRLTAIRTASGEIQIAGVDTESQWRPIAQSSPEAQLVGANAAQDVGANASPTTPNGPPAQGGIIPPVNP
jgi:hypothetical protein